jgi:hypothetical protein
VQSFAASGARTTQRRCVTDDGLAIEDARLGTQASQRGLGDKALRELITGRLLEALNGSSDLAKAYTHVTKRMR